MIAYLLEGQTANTDGSQEVLACSGGNVLVQASGTFGGATVQLEGRMHGFDFQALRDENGDVVSITAATTIVVGCCKSGFDIRAALTGASGTTDVSIGVL